MPDTPSDEELGLDPQEMERLDPNIRTELRNARKIQREASATAQRNADLERELALSKAGIPDNPLGQMFTRAYDGPLDDPAAIKTAFEALGVPQAPAPSGGQQGDQGNPEPGSDAEVERLRQLAQVGSTGDPTVGTDLGDAINSAKTAEEVMALLDTQAAKDAGIGPVQIQ